jgi:hypothetical protein
MTFALGYALYLAAFLLLAVATPARGLYLALLVLGFGVGVVNVLNEAVVFGLIDTATALTGAAYMTLTIAVLSGAAMLLSGKARKGAGESARLQLSASRVASVIAAYIVCYFVAGMAVIPFLRDFYADTPIPSLPNLLALQAARGAIYLLAAIPLLRLQPRWGPPVLGIAFALIAGLAPLAAENPLMPAYVRAAHAVEIGVSNFIFGIILVWLIGPQRPHTRQPATA